MEKNWQVAAAGAEIEQEQQMSTVHLLFHKPRPCLIWPEGLNSLQKLRNGDDVLSHLLSGLLAALYPLGYRYSIINSSVYNTLNKSETSAASMPDSTARDARTTDVCPLQAYVG